MTSGVPQNFNTTFINVIEDLLEKAEAIGCNINPYDQYSGNEDIILRELNAWMDEVDATFNTDELKKILPHEFFFPRNITLSRLPKDITITFGNMEYQQARLGVRKQLHEALLSQISTLKKIKHECNLQEKLITIYIEKDGTVWRDDRTKYFHKNPHLRTKRMRMLVRLVKDGGVVSTESLRKATEYKDTDTQTQEKRRLNQLLRKKLELQHDVILGGNERRMAGYEINPIYDVRLKLK